MNKFPRQFQRGLLATLAILLAVLAVACSEKPKLPPPEPPHALNLYRARGEVIRIKLSDYSNAPVYELSCKAGLQFFNPDHRQAFAWKSDAPVQLRYRTIYSMPRYWRLLIAHFSPDEKQRADSMAKKIELELGIPAEVIAQPYRRPWSLAKAQDNASLAVSIGRFVDRANAEAVKKFLPEAKNAVAFLDENRPFPGYITISTPEGRRIAEFMAEGTAEALDGKSPVLLHPVLEMPEPVVLDGASFRGAIQFFPEPDGAFVPVNVINVEDYLLSVVPSEIGDFAPIEAMKAQAVAARSEALCKLTWGQRHTDDRFDYVSGQMDQVYKGVEGECDTAAQAVRQTRGQVLLHKNKVIDAVYSHSCGGISATSEDIWGGIPIPYFKTNVDYSQWLWPADLTQRETAAQWIRSSTCTYCNPDQRGFPEYAKGFYRWEKQVTLEEIGKRINDRGLAIGDLKSISISQRTASGRVKEIEAIGTARKTKITDGDRIRVLMGGLHSNFFVFDSEYSDGKLKAYRFKGAGFGHGVGLCQIGAYMMAKRGWNYAGILHHYFNDVELRAVY